MRARDERGAIAVTIAVFFTAILGMAAVVMDGGSIRDEQAQLQNGVDSAALSLAKKCAYEIWVWCDDAKDIAEGHVDFIAEDGDARIVTAQVDKVAHTVRLVGGSDTKGTPSLPMRFAGVFGKSKVDVQAEAKAQWTPRVTRPWLSVPIARCVFDEALKDTGGRFPAYVRLDYTGSQTCDDGRPATVPDNLTKDDAPEFPESTYGILRTDVKCNNPSPCDPESFDDKVVSAAPSSDLRKPEPKEIVVSIWSKVSGSWRLDGFAGFAIESMTRNNGHKIGSVCARDKDCLSGWFTRTQQDQTTPGAYRLGGEVWLIK